MSHHGALVGVSLLVAGLAVGLSTGVAESATWVVAQDGTGDFYEIARAVRGAVAGDTVLVRPGTYRENIQFQGADIVLRSADGPEATVIDGSAADAPVVEFNSGESRACRIEGFTLTGGRGGGSFAGEKVGGGILVQDAEPTIIGNVVVGNEVNGSTAGGRGGGIFCRAGFPDESKPERVPLIQDNSITNNRSNGNGGGIAIQSRAGAEIIGNTIEQNTAARGDGGGIWILVRIDPMISIRDNRIANNRAWDHGGGLYAGTAGALPRLTLHIEGNLIHDNLAEGTEQTGDSGGGIWLACTAATVVRNTIVRNEGRGPGGGYGGGTVFLRVGSPVVERNIIALGVAGGGVLCTDQSTPVFRDNLLWANPGGDALGDCDSWIGKDGNVVADPLFCDAVSGDFSVGTNSPALTHAASPIGAIAEPGCSAGVLVQPTTWSQLKLLGIR
jgi:parallel beta-helix repeat protein